MADYFQKLNTTYQKPTNDENEKVEEVIKSNRLHGERVSLDTTEKRIVVLDYTGRVNNDFNVSKNSKIEKIYLHEMNISNEDVIKTLKENLVLKCVDGTYVMKDKDTMNLDKMIGLACIAMNQSEKNNKRLRTRNSILENKCSDYDRLVEERDSLKSELDEIAINLCLALGRRIDDNENVMHLINVCAALCARKNEYECVLKENDKLKYVLDAQRTRIRVNATNKLDSILHGLEKFKKDLLVKDVGMSRLAEDLCSVRKENEEKNGVLQVLREKLSGFSDRLVVEHNVHAAVDRRLIKEIDDYRERQNRLRCENEKLKSEIKQNRLEQNILISNENEHNDLKEKYTKMQYMYDELIKEIRQTPDNKYLVEKCAINEYTIRIFRSYLDEQVNKLEETNVMCHNEKTKCRTNEIHKQKMIEEFAAQIQKTNKYIQSMQKECCTLKNHLSCAELEIKTLKNNISIFDYVLSEKNKIITRLVDTEVDWKNKVHVLEKELKLKRNQIFLTEKIAKLQLQEACNTVQRLTEVSTTQVPM